MEPNDPSLARLHEIVAAALYLRLTLILRMATFATGIGIGMGIAGHSAWKSVLWPAVAVYAVVWTLRFTPGAVDESTFRSLKHAGLHKFVPVMLCRFVLTIFDRDNKEQLVLRSFRTEAGAIRWVKRHGTHLKKATLARIDCTQAYDRFVQNRTSPSLTELSAERYELLDEMKRLSQSPDQDHP